MVLCKTKAEKVYIGINNACYELKCMGVTLTICSCVVYANYTSEVRYSV